MVRTSISRAFLLVALTYYVNSSPINEESKEPSIDYHYVVDMEDDEAVKTRVKRKARLMYEYDDDSAEDSMEINNHQNGGGKPPVKVMDRAIKSWFFFGPRTLLRGVKKMVDFAEGGMLTISNSLRHTFTNLINSMS